MGDVSRYWTLVRIDFAGKRKIEEIVPVKEFFLTSFPEFMPESKVPDALIQRQLLHWMKETAEDDIPTPVSHLSWQRGEAKDRIKADNRLQNASNKRFLAEHCLLCFISSQIERVCQQLVGQFGADHGFTCNDLLPFVLDDEGIRQRRGTTSLVEPSYQSVLHEILQSFDPEQSSLATWTTRRVKHHKELNAFLLEQGVYLVSDWAILNDTSPKQLQRIFLQFHHLTPIEIQQAKQLLESYHAIYRAQRLKQRQTGIKGRCLLPTTEQLNQIGLRLSAQTSQVFPPQRLMAQLQEMADRLRKYRIYARGGSLATESLDVTAPNTLADSVSSRNFADNHDISNEQTEFLSFYHEQFLSCLDQAIELVTEERVMQLQRKNAQKAQKFLTALELFHCQEKSMAEIAPMVNLKAQFQVTRLIKLKSLRADVQQRLLVLLRTRVFDQAKNYTTLEQLQTLKIEEALNEQITEVIQEAATKASTAAKNQIKNSLFAQRLCRYLDTRRNES